MPAARASAVSCSKSAVPTPRPCQLVRDCERHLGERPIVGVANQPRDPDRDLSVERDKRVPAAVDQRQLCELGRRERGLGAAEPERAASALRAGRRRTGRASSRPTKRPDRDAGDVLRVHSSMIQAECGRRFAAQGHLSHMARSGQYALRAMEQDIRFVDVDGHRLAYATVGEGPLLILGRRWVSHLEADWEDAEFRAFLTELGQNHRVVRFDRFGTGLSERDINEVPSLDARRSLAGRGSRRLRRREGDAVRDVVLGAEHRALRARPPRTRRGDRLLRRVRQPARPSRPAQTSLVEFVRVELGARRAGAREPVHPARERRAPCRAQPVSPRHVDRRGGRGVPRARLRNRPSRHVLPEVLRAVARPASQRRPRGADRARARAGVAASERALRAALGRLALPVGRRPARAPPRARRVPGQHRGGETAATTRRSRIARPRCCASSRPASRTARSPRRSC